MFRSFRVGRFEVNVEYLHLPSPDRQRQYYFSKQSFLNIIFPASSFIVFLKIQTKCDVEYSRN